jgi:two-component system chemotaxis sensor kinase CheA
VKGHYQKIKRFKAYQLRNHSVKFLVAVRSGKNVVGLVVDRFIGEEEVMLKSLGLLIGKIPGIAGGAILGTVFFSIREEPLNT